MNNYGMKTITLKTLISMSKYVLIFSLLTKESLCQCTFDYDETFPREFGGNRGRTAINDFDYKVGMVGMSWKERFAFVGITFSGDIGTMTDDNSLWTNFIIYENAKDYA